MNKALDYGNLNVLLAKQLAEAENEVVELNKRIEELEDELANIKMALGSPRFIPSGAI